jgi:hypothetical protein
VWKRVLKDPPITVRQYNKASLSGYLFVDKTVTYLPDSGRKHKGKNQLTPILSFMVKEFKENVLLLSGQSVSVAKGVKEISAPNVSQSILACGLEHYTI